MKQSIKSKFLLKTIVISISVFLGMGVIDAQVLEITGNTVLQEDITDGIHVASGITATLDLNGHKVTGKASTTNTKFYDDEKEAEVNIDSPYAAIVNEGTLTIIDSKANEENENNRGKVSATTGNGYALLNRNGKVIINGGIFYSNVSASTVANGWYTGKQNKAKTYSELIINGGEFINDTTSNASVKNDEYGILKIYGGSFKRTKNSYYAIQQAGKELIIDGKSTVNIVGNIQLSFRGADPDRTIELTGKINMNGSINCATEATKTSTADLYIHDITGTIIGITMTDATVKRALFENFTMTGTLIYNGLGATGTVNNVKGSVAKTNGTESYLLVKNSTFNKVEASNGKIEIKNSDIATHVTTMYGATVIIDGGNYGIVSAMTYPTNFNYLSGGHIIIKSTENATKIESIVGSKGKNADSISSILIDGNNITVKGDITVAREAEVTINGGLFEGNLLNIKEGIAANSYYAAEGLYDISGGTFDNEPNSAFIKDGYIKVLKDKQYVVLVDKADILVLIKF